MQYLKSKLKLGFLAEQETMCGMNEGLSKLISLQSKRSGTAMKIIN